MQCIVRVHQLMRDRPVVNGLCEREGERSLPMFAFL